MATEEKLTILVVDDRTENLASMRQLLARPGLEILTAATGNEALGCMLDHDLALVLLDVQMPGMNGFEVAELMRRNERTRQVPIIFVTAIDKERRQVFTGYEAGAVDYLFKPVDPFVIRSKVAVFLEMKKSQLARERLVRELNHAYNSLQQMSDRRTDFLSAASHELRTPLTVIKEYCSLVHDGIVGGVNDEQRHCMGVALRNCNRLTDLVDDLLDLDAVESGHMACLRGRVEMADLFAACLDDFRESCSAADQVLTVVADPDLPPVLADPALVTQVLVNLVGNARKFTPAGGSIRVTARQVGQTVRVDVADTGPGIALADQERVFEKFTQLGQRDGGRRQGNGLGLAIVRRIMGLLEGEIGVESEPAHGARFHFTLPLHTEAGQWRAFVGDGVGDGVGDEVRGDWNLVLLRADAPGPASVDTLAETVHRLIRRGQDRAQRLPHAGGEHLAVLLGTDRKGTRTFLTRLEGEFAASPRAACSVSWVRLDPAVAVGGAYPPAADHLTWERLGAEPAARAESQGRGVVSGRETVTPS